MNLSVLYDEKRRKEIQGALSSGAPIEFRKRPPIPDFIGIEESAHGGRLFPGNEELNRLFTKQKKQDEAASPTGIDSGTSTGGIRSRNTRAEAGVEGIGREEEAEKTGKKDTN